MRILHINKFLYVAGGVERYMFEVADQCARAGHEIQYFSMADPRNRACAQSGHFVSPIAYNGTSLAYKIRKAPAAFPRGERLRRVRPETLRGRCRVGYRDTRIVELAKLFGGRRPACDPTWFDERTTSDESLYHRL